MAETFKAMKRLHAVYTPKGRLHKVKEAMTEARRIARAKSSPGKKYTVVSFTADPPRARGGRR